MNSMCFPFFKLTILDKATLFEAEAYDIFATLYMMRSFAFFRLHLERTRSTSC